MSDYTGTSALVIGGIALLGAFGALFKIIKKSDCWGIHITTRTPTTEHPQIIIAPPPSPATVHKNKIDDKIKEIEV